MIFKVDLLYVVVKVKDLILPRANSLEMGVKRRKDTAAFLAKKGLFDL